MKSFRTAQTIITTLLMIAGNATESNGIPAPVHTLYAMILYAYMSIESNLLTASISPIPAIYRKRTQTTSDP